MSERDLALVGVAATASPLLIVLIAPHLRAFAAWVLVAFGFVALGILVTSRPTQDVIACLGMAAFLKGLHVLGSGAVAKSASGDPTSRHD